ncbi:lysozyme inhibitor LprI family protein [Sporosarcina jeotgali]|uniref:Lysozyme inhibitor LprI family protein n=1 Tax=Sporosarcina jeotgali TaxID=3020056 RepID=A0ABZ0KWZ3_9BACL|nr:lysozyme inhibitor LprI family protein [Sporosarcina sp. B2O-1]WOV84750.1 lysozyme inhibitor LprI family protein [Sporosarcina sp. B2O-1]
MKKIVHFALLFVIIGVVLTGCGRSVEEELAGTWKIKNADVTDRYVEFGDGRLAVREGADSSPMTVDYRVTELEKGKFIIDIAEPGTSTYQFFMEGKIEAKNKIKILNFMDAESKDLHLSFERVLDMDKEIEIARKKEEKEAAAAKKIRDQEEIAAKTAEKKRQKAEEKALAEEKANDEAAKAEEREQQKSKENELKSKWDKKQTSPAAPSGSLQSRYQQKADQLRDQIILEARTAYPNDQDMRQGFYGQYYNEWDNLLNEIWGQLKQTMPANEFEKLKADQKRWIQQKEQGFADYSADTAIDRAIGMDYLATQTTERVDYLIVNYLR